MSERSLFYIGTALILAGVVLVFVAAVLLFFSSMEKRGKIKGGGAVIIGPFPIIFGTDKESVKLLVVLSIALIALLVFVIAFLRRVKIG